MFLHCVTVISCAIYLHSSFPFYLSVLRSLYLVNYQFSCHKQNPAYCLWQYTGRGPILKLISISPLDRQYMFSPEPEFVNVQGDQESIPPAYRGGPVRQIGLSYRPIRLYIGLRNRFLGIDSWAP